MEVTEHELLMRCPACQNPLIVVEYDRLEVDHCPTCEGTWLDAGELELIFGNPVLCREFLAGGDAVPKGEKPRKCPICSRRMEKHQTRDDSPVIYDVCRRGDGMWLDRGELEQILREGAALPGGEKVHAFLKTMFPDSVPRDE